MSGEHLPGSGSGAIPAASSRGALLQEGGAAKARLVSRGTSVCPARCPSWLYELGDGAVPGILVTGLT